MKRFMLASVMLVAACSCMTSSASAESTTKICVPEAASKPVLSASAKNECPMKSATRYKTQVLPGPVELEALDKILPHVKYVESGVGGKPTIQFSGVNVQIVNGEGKTESTNGAGNLILGYDERLAGEKKQTGSHNLILGIDQTFTSFGGIVDGKSNTISAAFASVTGGEVNSATNNFTSVSGGIKNTASGPISSISGGEENSATNFDDVVAGGKGNRNNSTLASAILGGDQNEIVGNHLVCEKEPGEPERCFEVSTFDDALVGGFQRKLEGSLEAVL